MLFVLLPETNVLAGWATAACVSLWDALFLVSPEAETVLAELSLRVALDDGLALLVVTVAALLLVLVVDDTAEDWEDESVLFWL